MKTKSILITLCLFCTSMGFAQNKIFDKYADMDDVSSIYISKAMFQIMPNVERIGVNLMNLKGKIESLQLVSSNNKERVTQMKKDFPQLVTSQHQELMRIKEEKNHNVKIYADMKGEQVKELIMLIDDRDKYTAILLVGNFTIKDIQEIVEQM